MRFSHKAFSVAALALSLAVMRAQEPIPREMPVEHPQEHENGEKEEPGTELDRALEAPHFERNAIIFTRNERVALRGIEVPVAATHIEWTRARNQDGTVSYYGFQVSDSPTSEPGPRRPLSSEDLHRIYATGATVVNSGDVPSGKFWHTFTADKGEFTVVHEKGSANSSWDAVTGAVALGDQPLNPQHTVIFNALPHETGTLASQRERTRMQIGGDTKAWKSTNDRIADVSEKAQSSEKIQAKVATKKELLDELAYGNSDVIIVYAHYDDVHQRLHLPGGSAENHANLSAYSISVEEIAKISRAAGAQNRVIILASCSTARHQGNVDSLAQVLLKHGIARSVFATDEPYNATNIPDMMQRLQAKTPLRKATGQLRQYVELRPPGELPQGPFDLRMMPQIFKAQIFKGSEIDFGE